MYCSYSAAVIKEIFAFAFTFAPLKVPSELESESLYVLIYLLKDKKFRLSHFTTFELVNDTRQREVCRQ